MALLQASGSKNQGVSLSESALATELANPFNGRLPAPLSVVNKSVWLPLPSLSLACGTACLIR